MRIILLIGFLLSTTAISAVAQCKPDVCKIVIAKAYEPAVSGIFYTEVARYWLYFDDGTDVRTNRKFHACYDNGDTAVFIFKELKNRNGEIYWSGYEMYNKCPQELKVHPCYQQ